MSAVTRDPADEVTGRFWYVQALSDRYPWILDQMPDIPPDQERDRYERVSAGDLSDIGGGPLVFKHANRSRRFRDMIWTCGSTKVASDRFIATLERIGATGWTTFPIEIHLAKGERLTGYQGIASTGVMTLSPPQTKIGKRPKNQVALWDGSDICGRYGRQSWSLIVADRALQALREDGADALKIEKFDRKVVPV